MPTENQGAIEVAQSPALITEPGIYQMEAARYHADPVAVPSLTSSCAWTISSKSPMHAKAECARLGGQGIEPTDAMDFGSVAHEIMLGKGGGFAIWDGKDWRGKEAGAFWDKAMAEGLTPMKAADHARVLLAVTAWKRQLADFGLGYVFDMDDADGQSEVVAVWRDGEAWCRAMIDRVFIQRAYIWDLKTMTQSAHPKACEATIKSRGLDLRSEFYKKGISANYPDLQGRVKQGFIFAETEPPFALTPIAELDGMWRTLGQSKCARAVDAWVRCLAANQWPGYVSAPVVAECPKYELDKEFGAETTMPPRQQE